MVYRLSTGSEGNPKESGDNLFDRAISVASAEPPATAREPAFTTALQRDGVVSLPLGEQCVYRPGFSGPSTRKFRRGFPIHSGLGKEQSAGWRKRMARGAKNSEKREKKELVRSDSNRAAHQTATKPYAEFTPDSPERKLSAKRHHGALQTTKTWGGWSNGNSLPQSATELQCTPWGNPSSPAGSSGRVSFDSLSDSSTMRIGSPTMDGPTVSLETSVDSAKSSLGGFLFDMEKGDQVYAMNHDEGSEDDIPVKDPVPSALLSPCTEMMAKLDLTEVLSSSSLSPDDGGSLGRNISGLSTDVLNAIRGSPLLQEDGSDKLLESTASESSVSIDSSFDALLSNTLDDLVLVCSAPTTPAETPRSSSLASSRSDAFFTSVI